MVVVRRVSQKGNHLKDRHGPAHYSPAIPLTSGTSYSSDSGDILMCAQDITDEFIYPSTLSITHTTYFNLNISVETHNISWLYSGLLASSIVYLYANSIPVLGDR